MTDRKRKNKLKESAGAVVCRQIIRIFLIFWSVLVAFPIVWVLYTSLKTNKEFFASPWSLPSVPQWKNYAEAWNMAKFGSYFLNSIVTVVITLAITLIIVAANAYVIAKYKNRFIAGLEKCYMVAMMMPAVLMIVPLYYFADSLHMTDSLVWLSLIYAIQGMPFYVFMMAGFVRGIHNALLEAATIDGAIQFQIFFRIILPMSKPTLLMVMLLNIMGTWNEYITALTFIRDESKYTIAIGLSYLTNSGVYDVNYGRTFAGLAIALIPILIVYGIFQKQIQQGMSSSDGVKG